MKKRTIILSSILGLAVVGGGGYGIYTMVKNGGSPVEVQPVEYLNQGYWGGDMSSSGTITSKASQEVYLDSNEVVAEVYVKEGDQVKVGDPLMAYDTTILELDLESYQLEGKALELELKGAEKDLKKLKSITPIKDSETEGGDSSLLEDLGGEEEARAVVNAMMMTASAENQTADPVDVGVLAEGTEVPNGESVVIPVESETKAPETETKAPESETKAPETETKAPETETKAPETETKAPETETKAPETETKAPETETKAPETEKQTESSTVQQSTDVIELDPNAEGETNQGSQQEKPEANKVLQYNTAPQKGEGTKENPYGFLCAEGAVIKASFLNKLLGFNEEGTSRENGGVKGDGQGCYVILVLDEEGREFPLSINRLQIDGTVAAEQAFDTELEWKFTASGLEKADGSKGEAVPKEGFLGYEDSELFWDNTKMAEANQNNSGQPAESESQGQPETPEVPETPGDGVIDIIVPGETETERETETSSIIDLGGEVPTESEPPATEAPTESEPPITEAPTESEPPVTEAPTESEPPITEAPTESEPPITEAPTESEPPITEAPTESEPPITEAPTESEPPITEAPTESEPPITEAPTESEPPTTEAPTTEPTTDTEPATETEPPVSPLEKIKPRKVLKYNTKPYKGDGTRENPYVFFCVDGAEIRASFMNKILGFNETGTSRKNGGMKGDGKGCYALLEIREGDEMSGGFIKSILLKGTTPTDKAFAPDLSWIFTTDGLRKVVPEIPDETEDTEVPEEPDDWWDDFWEDNEDVYTESELKAAIKEKEKEIADLKLSQRENELKVQKTKRQLEESTVLSSIHGIVKTVGDPAIGSLDGEAFIQVSSDSGLYVQGVLTENDLEKVKVGSTVTGYSYESGTSFTAEITEISEYPGGNLGYWSSDMNPNVSNYPFLAYIEEAEGLSDYDYAELQIQPDEDTVASDSLYIAKMYIRSENGQSYVYIEGEDGLLKKQYVRTGKTLYGEAVEIKEGLSLNDNIAFPYGKNVKEGAKTKMKSEYDDEEDAGGEEDVEEDMDLEEDLGDEVVY